MSDHRFESIVMGIVLVVALALVAGVAYGLVKSERTEEKAGQVNCSADYNRGFLMGYSIGGAR